MANKMKTLLPVALPLPAAGRGKTLFNALKRRKTTRETSGKKLPLQTLSDLLWAAYGVNREVGPFGIPAWRAGSITATKRASARD